MSRINADPVEIDEPKYGESGNFVLSSYLAANSGKAAPLFFINIQSAAAAAGWLSVLNALTADVELRPIAACFFHNGTAFQNLTGDMPITNALSAAGLTGTEFPVCRVAMGATAAQRLGDITGDNYNYGDLSAPATGFWDDPVAATPMMWGYIIDTRGKISDKWHANRVDDPLAAALCLPPGTLFPSGDITAWSASQVAALTSAIADRCVHLRTPLEILSARVSPPVDEVQSIAPGTISIPFSRPLDNATASPAANWVLDGPAVSAGAGSASTVGHTGRNFIENSVTLAYAGAALNDSLGWEMSLSFPSLKDAAGGAPAAGQDSITWDISTSVPLPTAAAYYGVDGAGARHAAVASTVGYHRIEAEISFNEPLSDEQTNPVMVTNLGTNAAQNIAFAINPADRAMATLSFNAQNSSQDGQWELSIAADALADGAGITGPASPWSGGSVSFDAAPPKPTLTVEGLAPGGSAARHKLRVSVDFEEEVSGWDTADIAKNFTIAGGGSLSFYSAGVTAGSYLYDWYLSGPGAKSIAVKAGAAKDSLGRDSLASDTFAFSYDPIYKDLVIVVDKSGSMGWDIPFDSGTGPADTRKWTVMEPRIEEFLAELRACIAAGTVHGTGDQLALISYDSACHSVAIAGSSWVAAGDVGDSMSPGPFEAALRVLAPGGSTAMASAIGEAYAMLDARPAGRDKALILFADGQRNAGAALTVVDEDHASDYFEIGAPYNRTVTRGAPGHYPIYATGIHTELASASQWLMDLQSVADISGGLYMDIVEVDPFNDLTIAFADFFDAIFGGHTPVTVARLAGTIPVGQASAELAFRLDRGLSGLVAAVAWPGAAGLGLRLYREGVPIAAPDASVTGPFHKIDTLVFPHVQYAPGLPTHVQRLEIESEGAWTAQVSRQGSAAVALPFVIKVIAEQDGPDPQVMLPGPPYLTGKACTVKIRLPGKGIRIDRAKLTVVNCPLSYANIAEVYAAQIPGLKPIDFRPIRATARKVDIPDREQKSWDLLNRQLRKIDRALMSKPELSRALSSRDVRVLEAFVKVLPSSGADCSWNIPAFTHPGHYRLEFVIEGSAKASGHFRRQVSRSLAVLPAIDLRKSIVEYKEDPRTGAFTALVRAQDKFGNLLGPGYPELFAAVDHQAGTLTVVDRMNGSYELSGKRRAAFQKNGEPPSPQAPRFFRGPGFFKRSDEEKGESE